MDLLALSQSKALPASTEQIFINFILWFPGSDTEEFITPKILTVVL